MMELNKDQFFIPSIANNVDRGGVQRRWCAAVVVHAAVVARRGSARRRWLSMMTVTVLDDECLKDEVGEDNKKN